MNFIVHEEIEVNNKIYWIEIKNIDDELIIYISVFKPLLTLISLFNLDGTYSYYKKCDNQINDIGWIEKKSNENALIVITNRSLETDLDNLFHSNEFLELLNRHVPSFVKWLIAFNKKVLTKYKIKGKIKWQ